MYTSSAVSALISWITSGASSSSSSVEVVMGFVIAASYSVIIAGSAKWAFEVIGCSSAVNEAKVSG